MTTTSNHVDPFQEIDRLKAQLENAERHRLALETAGDALLDSLGEFVRQSMHANREWQPGIAAWMETSMASKKASRYAADRPRVRMLVSESVGSADVMRAIHQCEEDGLIQRERGGREAPLDRLTLQECTLMTLVQYAARGPVEEV